MVASMTGFARYSTPGSSGATVWELRSVNHRHLDIRITLPDALRELEPAVRTRLQQAFARGRLEASLYLEPQPGAARIHYSQEQAKALIATLREIDQMMMNGARVSALEILNWPGILNAPPRLADSALQQQILQELESAIAALQHMRQQEGEHLQQGLLARLDQFAAYLPDLQNRRSSLLTEQRQRLLQRLEELAVSVDAQRLEQEIVLAVQRLDVQEELDRLQGHLAAARTLLTQPTVTPGRKLDFLLQELQRETNTLGAKAHDLETTRMVMELKVLAEQMREQIQNIE